MGKYVGPGVGLLRETVYVSEHIVFPSPPNVRYLKLSAFNPYASGG